jgi:hypothetical protein
MDFWDIYLAMVAQHQPIIKSTKSFRYLCSIHMECTGIDVVKLHVAYPQWYNNLTNKEKNPDRKQDVYNRINTQYHLPMGTKKSLRGNTSGWVKGPILQPCFIGFYRQASVIPTLQKQCYCKLHRTTKRQIHIWITGTLQCLFAGRLMQYWVQIL